MAADPLFIHSIQAVNVSLERQIIFADGQPVTVPGRDDLLAYLRWMARTYVRWADQPATPDPPLYAQANAHQPPAPDAYISTHAAPLLMPVSPLRGGSMAEPAPAIDLIDAMLGAHRSVILGEPGSGKSAALERLAWLTATRTLALPGIAQADGPPLTLPILARLADYQGAPDLLPLLRGAYNAHAGDSRDPGRFLGESALRLLLWRTDNVRFMLLLDGLNEFDQAYAATGRTAVRRHVRENAHHIVHLTCRTADFDPAVQSDPVTAVVPDASIWIVQPLADAIRHWDAQEGHSDVRDYLRQHLDAQAGRRLYERIHADDRLREAALIPLLLWMIKEVGGGGGGELPPDRGGLLRSFVETALHRHEVPVAEQDAVMRSLAAFGWRLQAARRLVGDMLELDAALREGCCVAGDDPATTRRYLHKSGLLLRVGADRYRLLHQLLQEYAAAADFVRQPDCANRLSVLARDDWQRELCILALWLHPALQTPAYLLGVLGDPAIDLRVRVAAGEILARVGDPRLKETPPQDLPKTPAPPRVIEPAMVTLPAGVAVLGGEDPEGDDNELPAHPVPVAAFALAVHPVTNAEYACFMAAGGYDDPTLWTPAGQTWLEGKGSLDAESEATYRNIYRALAQDAEALIARLRQAGQAIDDAMADGFRQIAAEMSEDEFVQMYTEAIWSEQRREPVWWDDSRFNGLNQPVVGVNWYEAMAYAAWLARVTGKAYRLPTEAEWEWAARRNTRRYPWPGAWDASRCNWSGSRLNRPAPIGLFPHGATPDGLHDLAGNVYEWTASLYRPYPYVAADGREAADAGGLRVMRGGSWYTGQGWVRGGYRDWISPWNGNDNLGYRLARTLS